MFRCLQKYVKKQIKFTRRNLLSYPHSIKLIGIITVNNRFSFFYFYRYGRITGSTLHEAAHCKTKIGSLLNRIMGEHSKFTSIAMDRGKKLEKEVLKVVSKKEKVTSLVYSVV